MRTTRVFRSGNSQAVRIPVDLAFTTDRVSIEVVDGAIVLRPASETMAEFLASVPLDPDYPLFDDSWDEPLGAVETL